MPNVYIILPSLLKNNILIKSKFFISANYEEVGETIYVRLNYKNEEDKTYNWLSFLNKIEKNFYSINFDENDSTIIVCTYVIPKNKLLFCKSILNDCMQNVGLDYVKQVIKWYK